MIINMGIIISNFRFSSLNFHSGILTSRENYSIQLNESFIANRFTDFGDCDDVRIFCYRNTYDHHSNVGFLNCFYITGCDDREKCHTLLRQICNKYVVIPLRSSIGVTFCAAIQYPTLRILKHMRNELFNKLILCASCTKNELCYDVMKIIIKILMTMELIDHYVTNDPIFLQWICDSYLNDHHEQFKSFIKNDHETISRLLFY